MNAMFSAAVLAFNGANRLHVDSSESEACDQIGNSYYTL